MKRCLFTLLILSVFKTYAQVPNTLNSEPIKTLYGTIEFTTPFYNLEERWAVLPKNAQINKYLFGMVYVDNTAGYTFRLEGFFQVDEQGHVFRDSTDYVKNNNVTVARVGAGTKLLGAIPAAMLPILKVKPVPEWLAIYHPVTLNREATAYKIAHGRFLNGLREPAKALEFLEPVYKTDPHAAGLEYELSYAYNILGRTADAITILKGAIAATPDNGSLYAELGYAYVQNKDYTTAVDVFLKGLDLAKKKNDDFFRNTMTTNLTLAYTELKQYDKAVGIVNQFLADSPN
ncbi:MAG: tetratricopeptide repeat protein, partial [Mucilaginibacter sp.]